MDGEFELGREFLKQAKEPSEFHPCINRPTCGFPHRVVMHAPTRLVAVAEGDGAECLPFKVEPHDLLVYAVDKMKFCGAVARAFKFEATLAGEGGLPDALKVWTVGTYARTRSPVYFCLPGDFTLANIEGLINAQKEPFILLAASPRSKSATVQSLLQRQRCEFIPLANSLALDGKGKFKETNSIQPILDRFAAQLADVPTIKPVLEGIHRAIAAGHEERRELREAKDRLEQMHGENLFKFVQKIDDRAFRIVCTVLVHGDVAKASRALDMKDSTLREIMRSWKNRGPAYLGLLDLIRWRKGKRLTGAVPFNESLLYKQENADEKQTVFKDLLDGILSMTDSNWPDICAELETLLRKQLGG